MRNGHTPDMHGIATTPLLPVAVSMMAGIVAASLFQPDFPLAFVLVAAVAGAMLCYRWPTVQSVAIYCCCAVLGMALGQKQHAADADILDRELEAVIMSEPAERPKTIGVDLLVPSAGGHTLRCYLWKDERSKRLRLGDEVVLRLTDRQYSDWHPGGNALGRLSLWQRSRLWFLKQRHHILEHYRGFQSEAETYAVLSAMTLGDKSAQTRELRESYAISGASHILAISGLHVSIVYMMLTWFMLGRRRFWLSQIVTVSAIWAFAMLTGLSPSVTRAATMITLYSLFTIRGGLQSPLNVLCFAAIVMLLADAGQLFDVSFQLSFAAVTAIVTLMPLLQDIIRPQNVVLRWAWNIMLLSLCAQVGTAPLIAYYFGRIPTLFLLTNIIVIPAATLILYGSLLSLLLPPVGIVLVWVVRALNGCMRVIASIPGASIDGLHPTQIQVAMAYMLIAVCAFLLNILKNYSPVREK